MSSNTPTPILVPFNLSSLSPQHWNLSSAPCPMNKQPGRPSSRPPSITGESQKRHALSSPLREGDGVSHKRQRMDSPEPLCNLRKPDAQQSLVMVINSFNDKLDSQERHFNHKLAEQETRWQTRFENLESKWVGKLALAELEVERSKTKATSIEMDLRERVGRLEGALAVLMRQSQDTPMPMGNISSIDYHTRGGQAFAPHGVATSSGQAHADLEQTLTPLWSREQAIEDLNEQQVVKIQPPDTVDDKIVVEIQDMSMSIDLTVANDEVDTTLSGREHDHANKYFKYVQHIHPTFNQTQDSERHIAILKMTPSYLPSARKSSSPTTLPTISNPIPMMTWKPMARTTSTATATTTTTATMTCGSTTLLSPNKTQQQPSLPHLQSIMLSPLPLAAAGAAAAAQSTTVYKEKQAHQQRRCYQPVMDLGEPKEDGHPKGPTHWLESWQVAFHPPQKDIICACG